MFASSSAPIVAFHIYNLLEAQRIDELTRGSVLRLKFSQTTSTQNESVLCVLFEFVDHGGRRGDTAQALA
jgi:hypothetical protein